MNNFYPNCDGYSTPAYSVWRWNAHLVGRPGTYRVIANWFSLSLIRMGGGGDTYEHPTCVVDDFGSLVRVPS